MNREDFFTGKTECYLLDKLKKDKVLFLLDIYSSYSNQLIAKAFISKLITFGIAESAGFGKLRYVDDKTEEENDEVYSDEKP